MSIEKELREKLREDARTLIISARDGGLYLYELTEFLKEEWYSLKREEREKRIHRTPEETEFRQKAEKFLKRKERILYPEIGYRHLPIFENEEIFYICVEILCVYNNTEEIASKKAYKILSERLAIDEILVEKYEWYNLFCSIVTYYHMDKEIDENIELRYQIIRDFIEEIKNQQYMMQN